MKAADSSTSPTMVDICERNVSLVASQRSRSITKLLSSAIDRSTFACTFSRSVLIACACEISCAYSSLYAAMLCSSCAISSFTSLPCLMFVSAWRSSELSSSRSGSTRLSMSAYSTCAIAHFTMGPHAIEARFTFSKL